MAQINFDSVMNMDNESDSEADKDNLLQGSSSSAQIYTLLPMRTDAFLVNSFMSHHLGVLGIEENKEGDYVAQSELRKAYHEGLRRTHPDKNKTGNPDTTAYDNVYAAYHYIQGELNPDESVLEERRRRVGEIMRQNIVLKNKIKREREEIAIMDQSLTQLQEEIDIVKQVMRQRSLL